MPIVTIGGRAGATFGGMQDALLIASDPNTNYPAQATSGGFEVVLLRPDLSGITGPLTVVNAFWTINVTSGAGGANAIPMPRCLRAWPETQATFNAFATSNNWATAGAAGSGTDRAAASGGTLSYPGGFATGDLSSTGNAQLIADLQAYFDGSISDFSSIFDLTGLGFLAIGLPANATAALRPLLTIEYNIAGGADLAGSATATAAASGNLSTNPALAGSATATAAATGNLTTSAADRLGALILVDDDIDHSFVDGAGAIDGDPYDAVAAGEALEGAAAGTATAAGAITTSVRFNGVALIVGNASGALSTGLRLNGSAAAIAVAGGNLTAQVRLSGAAITQALAAAGLNTQLRLAGNAAAGALAAASITAQIQFNGAAVTQALAAGELLGGTNLAGNAQAGALASGALTTSIPLIGAALAQAQAAGSLSTALRLAGAASAAGLASGTLTSPVNLSGAAVAIIAGTGALTASITFNAAALATALAGGDLVAHIRMSGAAVAQASASGLLAVEYTPAFNRRYRVHRPRRNLRVHRDFTRREAA
jgi:hypothetical protein